MKILVYIGKESVQRTVYFSYILGTEGIELQGLSRLRNREDPLMT